MPSLPGMPPAAAAAVAGFMPHPPSRALHWIPESLPLIVTSKGLCARPAARPNPSSSHGCLARALVVPTTPQLRAIMVTQCAAQAAATCSTGSIQKPITHYALPAVLAARRKAPAAAASSSRRGSRPCSSGRQWRRAAAAAEGASAAASTVAPEPTAAVSSKGVPQSDVWELDFCSRPILDERGKKVGVGALRGAGQP